jgi:hypothetical protein
MTAIARVSKEGGLVVHVPFKIRLRGGRKQIVTPDGCCWSPQQPHYDNALIKALGRAFRWRRLLEAGAYASTRELAAKEKINESYVCRLLRLTLLAPDIVEAVLKGKQPPRLQLPHLLNAMPTDWNEQKSNLTSLATAKRLKQDSHLKADDVPKK